jgi:predicted  nucleic acid-binding Zn-ribbon protein
MSALMQQQLVFDRYAFAQKLKTSGFNEAQTDGLTSAFDGAIRDAVATRQDVLDSRSAAKTDISELRSEMKDEFASVRAEMKDEFASVRAEMKDEFASVRAEMARIETKIESTNADMKLYIYRGLLLGGLSVVGGMFGIGLLLARLFIK